MAQLEIKPTLGARARVYAVILAGICITGALMYLLSGGTGDIFARRTTLITYMPDGTGISDISPVRLSGIPIGVVRKVDISDSLDPQRSVRVELRVKTQYLRQIPQDSLTSLGEDNLVGDKYVSIAEGKSPLPIAENGELHSEPFRQALDRADLVRTLERNLFDVDKILQDVASGRTQLGQMVLSEKYYQTILARVVDFDRAVHSMASPSSDMGKDVFTNELYRKIREPVIELDKSLLAIQNGQGPAGKLFASDEQYDQMLRNLRSVRATIAAMKASPIVTNDDQYQNAMKLLKATDAMISSLNAGEGKAGQQLVSAQLYESLNGSLRSMQTLLADLRQNPQKYLRIQVF